MDTGYGVKVVRLVTENLICEWLPQDNPEMAKSLLKLGVRLFMHKLAGYEPQNKLPTTPLELAKLNLKLAHENVKLLEDIETMEKAIQGYQNVFSGESTLTMKQASDCIRIKSLGQNNLIKYLRKKGMVISKGSSPTKVAIDRGYLQVETSEWESQFTGDKHTAQKGVFTWKGFCWLIQELKADGYAIRQTPQAAWDNYYPRPQLVYDSSLV
jgi:phage antirepressor YoqD-like protein